MKPLSSQQEVASSEAEPRSRQEKTLSFLVFLTFLVVVAAIVAGFMASLVYAPALSRFARRRYDGRPRRLGGS